VKITNIEALQLRLRTVENIFDGTQDVLVVRVDTDDGWTGYGEVVSSSAVAKAIIEAPRSGGGRHGLREIVVGMDASDPEAVWDAMMIETQWYGRRGVAVHAMAGIDIALWDLVARSRGEPLFRVLRPDAGEAPVMKAYASLLWGETTGATAALVEEVIDKGFRAVKFGFGDPNATLEQDIARILGAREALAGRGELMMDVGRRWTAEEAIRRSAAIQELEAPPLWLEEPLPPDDLEGYTRLCAAVDIPIASAETEETPQQFQAFIDAGVRIIQPDLGRVGLTQAMRISEMARAAGVTCVPHCFGTGINTTAAIHWMAATGNDLTEYPMRTNRLCRDLATGVPPIVDGVVAPSRAPGLGLELDADVVESYAYSR
jgi:L-rhamnonate dehydratase